MLFEKFKQPNQGTEKKKTFEMHVFKEDLGASFLLIHKKKICSAYSLFKGSAISIHNYASFAFMKPLLSNIPASAITVPDISAAITILINVAISFSYQVFHHLINYSYNLILPAF